ncbi:hypothetical protein PR048_015100 [Dryococelus australis]|uniref:Uncharacterized protein n=1 Tax=Dryococelus australis TaxID=614101 RepID=A0ABQ9HG12_9NEOP|nr:hypothetical protein PR048_015100 [Dryococelus australis]
MNSSNPAGMVIRFGIMPFEGTNFHNWSHRIKTVLTELDLLKLVGEENGPEEKDWLRKYAKAKNASVQEKYTQYYKIISNEPASKLLTLKFSESSSSTNHFVEFHKIARELRTGDAKPDSTEIICHLLLSMPESYENVVTAIETMHADDFTIECVKTRLLYEAMKRK